MNKKTFKSNHKKLKKLCKKYKSTTVNKYSKALTFLATVYIPVNKSVYSVIFTNYGVTSFSINLAGDIAKFKVYAFMHPTIAPHLISIVKNSLNNYNEIK